MRSDPRVAPDDVAADIGSEGDAFEESGAEADADADVDAKELLDDAKEEKLASKEEKEDEELEDDEAEIDPEEDEYVVEGIRSHRIRNGKVEYHIKWLGYEEDDNTWEPEDNLLPHAAKLLAQYQSDIGGPPTAKNVKKVKSKQSLRRQSSAAGSPAPKRRKRNGARADSSSEDVGTWLPPKDDWESYIQKVETVEKNEFGQLTAYILFNNGKKTRVGMDKVYRHCPRPMLKFYEDHLKFK
ncbi:hypothetical protein A1O3_02613 [Capronia epimyces CBS 606.96]|uniref:Chromo domain-containing protein n=1 Tax=Capronia epimyces CBS 606.96 TaxID=1182542 RepID=W9YJX1_9EURO|nr:uncharacterized protein A1O3_02613 [Capronia epimyces CBS 606.96]EXJ89546.1 hypothetical protein A1O3_02613 [Capronia epimyces CBS 606.96]